ncbi:hypothetical protein [Cellvibrio sp. PSBB006]|uniref:hypothetical protein n=1 Tax=Cellvibrio sp. PSBB006 TaxID=1987723 RepID=UPI000B3B75AD|nr:hypothetical protein [Cellvibrio sp. PSBB006]ARU28747.1 hypothetical protein CBR65_15580 [Cellvibrio sp. PSBB006]
MLMLNIVKRTHSIENKIILVLIMLSMLTSIFSSSAQAEKNKLYPRQINLSGNVFHFSMPEDFSKDMPADDMVETLDISDFSKFDNPEYGNLVRRWWDIKEPGWFGKELGTVMFDLSVQRSFSNTQHLVHQRPYEISNRLDFMMMLHDSFMQRYEPLNEAIEEDAGLDISYHSSFAVMIGDEVAALQRDAIFNQQKWTAYSIAAPRGELIVVYAIPVTENVYLEASLTYSHNDNVPPLEFRRGHAFSKFEPMVESFKLDYVSNNPLENVVGKVWLEQSATDTIKQNPDLLIRIFDGEPEERILPQAEQP